MEQIEYEGKEFKKPNREGINPSKFHGAISRDLRNGVLTKQPCEICGSENAVAHHEVYAEDYEIRWLCQKHHIIIHNLFRDNIKQLIDGTLVQLAMPNELNYALDMHLATLRRDGIKTTKPELIIKLMRIGLLKESAKIINEGRVL